jgi:hypothetical protein
MERFANQLVSNMRAVKIRGINMIDSRRYRRAQDTNSGVRIGRRTKYAGAG